MPNEDNTKTSTQTTNIPEPVAKTDDSTKKSSVIVDPDVPEPTEEKPVAAEKPKVSGAMSEIIDRINESNNVLIALSSDPSVDEMAAAIGLSLYLDKLGKRATAIYSGTTPNALEFLKPEETFESSVDTLQDFIIALNKEKADHLRYKLDGDFVKIYITPYRTRIAEGDLDFSYGDFNVDLVLALNVANGIDLDSALREHGRIMHDATIVNITTGNPGKLGEIEWSDKTSSSISEMVAKLLYNYEQDAPIEKDEATAFLTGIVAATNRFSNAKTSPEVMELSSKLMQSGANQQLISKNITPEVENKLINANRRSSKNKKSATKNDSKEDAAAADDDDLTKLDIAHDETNEAVIEQPKEEPEEQPKEEPEDSIKNEPESSDADSESNELLDDLKAAEATLSHAGAETTPEPVKPPININEAGSLDLPAEPTLPQSTMLNSEEKVITPSAELSSEFPSSDGSEKYGQMLEDALESVGPKNTSSQEIFDQPSTTTENPAALNAPSVPANPEINGVPSINYMPMPGEEVLPPPPAPPIDVNAAPAPASQINDDLTSANPIEQGTLPPVQPITPAAPVETPAPAPLGEQPAMQDQIYNPQAADPGAFKIPGM